MPGIYEDSRERNIGFDAASWATILEQGPALGQLLGMKTSLEREAQGESRGEQPPPTASAAGRAAVPSSPEVSDGEGEDARREGDVPAGAGKFSNSQSPTVEV